MRLFAIMPTVKSFVMRAGREKRETDFAGWTKTSGHCGGRRDPKIDTHADFKNMTFIRSREDVADEGRLPTLMTQL